MIDSYEKYRQVAKYAGGYFEEQFLELINRLEAAESARCDDYQNWMTALDRNAELLTKLEAAEKERGALQAKIEQMERQEPVAWMSSRNGFICKENKNPDYNVPLYALPGAQTQPALNVPEGWIQRGMAELEAIRNRLDDDTLLDDRTLIERIGKATLAAAPEAKP